jgi:hypothetical protein
MRRNLSTLSVPCGVLLAGAMLTAAAAGGQATTSQNVVSSSPSNSRTSDNDPGPSSDHGIEAVQPTTPSIQPVADAPEATIDPASLLPDLPPLPRAKASLIGGTIGRLDRVRDEMTVQLFGGGKMKIFFDPRTHIDHDGKEVSASDLRQGDRVYIDTILDGTAVFARSIRLKSTLSSGESQGIVTSYRSAKGELEIRDMLSPRPMKVRLTSQTQITNAGHAASASALVPGALVAIKFGAQQSGGDVAREISVLAVPGASFTFAGRVAAVDLRLGLLVLTSSTDRETYEIHFDPSTLTLDDNVRPGADVSVLTRFDGNQYRARTLTVNSQPQR